MLGTVLGVGKDADGTTYLADTVTSPIVTGRVFVSQGRFLFRKRLLGSGSNGDSDYTLTFDDDSGGAALLIHRENGKATAMALGPTNSRGFIGDPGAVTTNLTVEDESVLSAFTLRNLPGDVTIENVADVEDGSEIVVTHPAVDYEYTDFRLFYGRAPKLAERHVTNTSRGKSGSTVMTFVVGTATYTLNLPWVTVTTPDGGITGGPDVGTLDAGGGKTFAVTQRWPAPTALPGLSFTCL